MRPREVEESEVAEREREKLEVGRSREWFLWCIVVDCGEKNREMVGGYGYGSWLVTPSHPLSPFSLQSRASTTS